MANIKDEVIPDPENTHKHVMVHQAAGVAVCLFGVELSPAQRWI